jgi:hypothetical protein
MSQKSSEDGEEFYSDETYFEDESEHTEFEEEIEIDGDFEIQEYNSEYSPFSQFFNPSPRILAAPKPVQINGLETSELDSLFESKMTFFSIPKNFPKTEIKDRDILYMCRAVLENRKCLFGKNCKFAHSFFQIKKCKFDYCKKTKLIGNGLFLNTVSNICLMRHNLETVSSYIFRVGELVNKKITLSIYNKFFEEFCEALKKSNFIKIQLEII